MSTPARLSTADLAKANQRPAPAEVDAHAADPQGVEVPVGREGRPVDAEDRAAVEAASPLFQQDASDELSRRWDTIQAGFVDEPRRAVEEADSLVADTMKRLAETFAHERSTLEQQWDRGGDVSTEDLRIALQRYRSFFRRLLSV